ncbi:hypothetical protein BaRGS_00004986, partial [Batillaria attramentaria]
GEALLCSMVSRSVIGTYHFHNTVHQVKFSPDGKKFAVTRDTVVLVFHTPGRSREFNPFVLFRTYYGAYDATTCIDWSSDSKVLVVGSQDMNARVFAVEPCENFVVHSFGGHIDALVSVFFEHNSMDVYSVSKRGHLCVWRCNINTTDLVPRKPKAEKFVTEQDMETDEGEQTAGDKDVTELESDEDESVIKVHYRKVKRHVFKGSKDEGESVAPELTCCAYHKPTHILISGFENGSFLLHEMPDFNLIHSLRVSDQSITSIAVNNTGDWIALGCAGLGQLLVWEWQSESYVLKQQGHYNKMACVTYSQDGQHLATGGDDGKVKVWNTSSGFCFVTFNEHAGGVTGVTFTQTGQVVISSSLDGTVRAFDLNRYRNFKTFTSPRPVQFSCLAVDSSGEIICAGGQDVFEIFVWSMQTGRLLEVLADHEGPVSCLSFSKDGTLLASGSWDKTVKLWDVFESRGAKETLTQLSDVLAVTFRPDGRELAVATLNGQVSFWNPVSAVQTGTIEGRHDLGYGRKDTDLVTGKKLAAGKAFNTVCYSADGKCILAAGRSKNVCIYSVANQILMKKFEISCNHSLDGMEEFLDKRKMTEWGSLALVDEGQGDEKGKKLALPGVREGDLSSRHWRPEVRVAAVQFSPTGREWVAATTEGLLIYSLDQTLVFDPFELEMDITPASVRDTLAAGDHARALMLAFRLNEQSLIQEVLESTPPSDVESISQGLPAKYVDRLLTYVGGQLESTAHLEFYVSWVRALLTSHGPALKKRSQAVMATLRTLQKNLTRKHEDIGKLCDHNQYSLQFLIAQARLKRKAAPTDSGDDGESEENMDSKGDDEGYEDAAGSAEIDSEASEDAMSEEKELSENEDSEDEDEAYKDAVSVIETGEESE